MEIEMDPMQKQMLDDVFEAFTMLAGGNFVSLMHVDGGFTRYSPGAVKLLNLPGEYIPNGAYDWGDYLHPEDRKRYMEVMGPLTTGESMTYDITYRVRTKENEYNTFRAIGGVLRNAEGKPSLIGGLLINQGLMEDTDPITVLRNKYGFFADLNALMQTERNMVILLVGISGLSALNQTHGYSYGNRVLQEMAWLIQETVRERGKVYRMDGATFAFLTEGISPNEAAAIYDALRVKFQRGIQVDGIRSILTANGGMISVRSLQLEANTIYSCLNYAYKESQYRKHGELVDFNSVIQSDVQDFLKMLSTIRNSIQDGCAGFSLRYQPVIQTGTEQLLGVEALVRWEGELYGEVEPMEFLPILEKDFMFEDLSGWIFRQVAEDGKRFLEKNPELIVGVNVSAAQIEDAYFVEHLKGILAAQGFPGKNLCLEITKDCRLLDMERLRALVDALHQEGIRVIIDDFGAGFESIGFLKKLSADFIKFDRELVVDIEKSEADRETMRYLSKMANLRGSHVIAKGVETAGMHDILKEFCISSMQGNYFSRPVPVGQILETYF